MLDAARLIPSHDVLFVTLDTLRYDVAVRALACGQTPNLAVLLPDGRWQRRTTPGSFTYAAHHAFFAGFLPAPIEPGLHPRLLALEFTGSETIDARTCVLPGSSLPQGLAALGYRTLCIGGVGFFNPAYPLGRVLPGMFQESFWSPELGVTDPRSTEHQVALACRLLSDTPRSQRVFLFLNVSALHQPNCGYLDGATEDSPQSQQAALSYVDRQLPALVAALRRRGGCLCIVCSDHGTAYGDDGLRGHRQGHPSVWTVPYAEFLLEAAS